MEGNTKINVTPLVVAPCANVYTYSFSDGAVLVFQDGPLEFIIVYSDKDACEVNGELLIHAGWTPYDGIDEVSPEEVDCWLEEGRTVLSDVSIEVSH